MVREFTKLEEFHAELKDQKNENKLFVIDFFATWCGPCQRVSPKIEAWSTGEYKDKVIFLKVDVDDAEAISEEYKIESMPTFVFIKNSKEIARVVGADPDKLKAAIESHLEKGSDK